MIALDALVGVLIRKGVITQEEILAEVKAVRGEMLSKIRAGSTRQ